MEKVYIEDKTFDKVNYKTKPLIIGEYEKCIFFHCDFSETNLYAIVFSECEFLGCNFSLANIAKTAFRKVKFKDCKLLGLRFDYINDFLLAFEFENCNLNLSCFQGLKIRATKFINCTLQEVDFCNTDLSNSILHNCDLTRATFLNTILEKADLRTAYNFSIDPELNRIKKARFSTNGISGLLDKYDIEIE